MSKKVFPFLITLAGLAVSASAASYSVSGLIKLFAGESLAVGIMATTLEVSKLVIASLLYQYWFKLNKVLRTYLTLATTVLILITSIGIYGFLTSAYQSTITKHQIIDKQVQTLENRRKLFLDSKKNLNVEKTQINSIQSKLSENLSTQYVDRRGNLIIGSNKGSNLQLSNSILTQEKLTQQIKTLNDSILNLETQILTLQSNSIGNSELGSLIYLSRVSNVPMDKIINYLLLVIIFVFDPLAIALIIAGNFAFKQLEAKKNEVEETPGVESVEIKEEDEWVIEDEEKVQAVVDPIHQEIENINKNQHLSEWGKRSKIEQLRNKYKKEYEGKRYW